MRQPPEPSSRLGFFLWTVKRKYEVIKSICKGHICLPQVQLVACALSSAMILSGMQPYDKILELTYLLKDKSRTFAVRMYELRSFASLQTDGLMNSYTREGSLRATETRSSLSVLSTCDLSSEWPFFPLFPPLLCLLLLTRNFVRLGMRVFGVLSFQPSIVSRTSAIFMNFATSVSAEPSFCAELI
jgi:hypothetical protein